MAQYKVPQDVEAEDKLLGPFTFRQFVYLMITAAFIATAWALAQIFLALALIPLPFIVFFAVLALPLKKDQPMETYLAAVVSFYLKPNRRFWIPGERESTILITAPKQVEKPRSRNITEEEASHRLSFLADLVDTEGYSIKNGASTNSAIREEFLAEADAVEDVMDNTATPVLNQIITEQNSARHDELVEQMRTAIARTEALKNAPYIPPQPVTTPAPAPNSTVLNPVAGSQPVNTNAGIQPAVPENVSREGYGPSEVSAAHNDGPARTSSTAQPLSTPARPDIAALANNKDYSIETISKEAHRLKQKDENEVYISLH